MLFFMTLTACGGDPLDTSAVDIAGDDTAASSYTYDVDIAPIIATNCTDYGCHYIEGSANALTDDVAYSNLLTEPSDDIPSMARVAPGSPEDSYLWHKINDTHLTLDGGDGLSMPLNYPLMDAASLSIIEDWILQGAVEN